MKLSTLRKLIFEKNLLGFLRLGSQTQMLYRSAFAVAAGSSGVLGMLAEKPCTAAQIARGMGLEADRPDALAAWLECGVKAGELSLRDGHYAIKGKLSRLLAQPANDVAAALFEEVARYHYDAILQAPARLRERRAYTLDDQDGELIARSSRILEPFVEEAVDWALRSRPPRTVLEVGCGAGHYLRYMAQRQPNLAITAIDYQADVVALAARNVRQWSLQDRVALRHADVLAIDSPERFDLITLHNNVYYFTDARREALLHKLHGMLNAGGQLLVTTSCRDGSTAVAALHLWWSLSDVAAGLPDKALLQKQLLASGFAGVQARQLLPGESYYGFLAGA